MLRIAALIAAALGFQFVAAGETRAESKPNILWIIAEDMSPDLGCNGTPEARTPNIDNLAKRGMMFENAFTVTPVCSTSRSSFMTGMYAMTINAHNHRSHRNGTNPLPDGVRVLTDWLRPAGYYTGNIRKLTNDPKQAKFHKGTGKTDWNFTYPKGEKPFDTDQWDDLKDHQPFYAQVNFSETHRGGAWNNAHNHIPRRADPAKVEIPPYYPDHPVTRAVWAQYLNSVMAVDEKVKFILGLLKRDGLAGNTIVIFMADHGRAMPRGKQWPYDSGLRIPLIIYWPEGNDDLLEPRGYARNYRASQLVSSIDITASTLDFAGVTIPAKMQGRVFLGKRADPPRLSVFSGRDRGDETVFHVRTIRDKRYRYIRNKYPERPFLQLNRYKEASYPIIGLLRHLHNQGTLRGAPAALMADRRPPHELYDLKNDPWEINNLANSPQHLLIREGLSRKLLGWQQAIKDRGLIAEAPEIPKQFEEQMKKVYDGRLESRPANWFETDAALGPYRKK